MPAEERQKVEKKLTIRALGFMAELLNCVLGLPSLGLRSPPDVQMCSLCLNLF